MTEEKEKSSERPSHSSRGGRSSGGRGHRRVSSDVTGYSSLASAELDDTLLEGGDLIGDSMTLDIDSFGELGGDLGVLPSPFFGLLGPSPMKNGLGASPMNFGNLSGMASINARITPKANSNTGETPSSSAQQDAGDDSTNRTARPAPRLSAPPPPHNPAAAAAVGLLAIPSPISSSYASSADITSSSLGGGRSRSNRGGRGIRGKSGGVGRRGDGHRRRNSDPDAAAHAKLAVGASTEEGQIAKETSTDDEKVASSSTSPNLDYSAWPRGTPASSRKRNQKEATEDDRDASLSATREDGGSVSKKPPSSSKRRRGSSDTKRRRQHRRSQSEPIVGDWMEEMGLLSEFGLGHAAPGSGQTVDPLQSTEWTSIPEKNKYQALSPMAATISNGPTFSSNVSSQSQVKLLPFPPATATTRHGFNAMQQQQLSMTSFPGGFPFNASSSLSPRSAQNGSTAQTHTSIYPTLSPRAALLAAQRGYRSGAPGVMYPMYSAITTSSAAAAAAVAAAAASGSSVSNAAATPALASVDAQPPQLSSIKGKAPSFINAFVSMDSSGIGGGSLAPSLSTIQSQSNSGSRSVLTDPLGIGLAVDSKSNSFEGLEGADATSPKQIASIGSLKGIVGAGSFGSFDLNETDSMLRHGALVDAGYSMGASSSYLAESESVNNLHGHQSRQSEGSVRSGGTAEQRRNRGRSLPKAKDLISFRSGRIGGNGRRGRSKPVADQRDGNVTEDNRGRYRCGRCGKFKVNHVCPFVIETACRSVEMQADPTVPVIKTGRERTIRVRRRSQEVNVEPLQKPANGNINIRAKRRQSVELPTRTNGTASTPLSTIVTSQQVETSLAIMQQHSNMLKPRIMEPSSRISPASTAMKPPENINIASSSSARTPMTPMTAALAFSPAIVSSHVAPGSALPQGTALEAASLIPLAEEIDDSLFVMKSEQPSLEGEYQYQKEIEIRARPHSPQERVIVRDEEEPTDA